MMNWTYIMSDYYVCSALLVPHKTKWNQSIVTWRGYRMFYAPTQEPSGAEMGWGSGVGQTWVRLSPLWVTDERRSCGSNGSIIPTCAPWLRMQPGICVSQPWKDYQNAVLYNTIGFTPLWFETHPHLSVREMHSGMYEWGNKVGPVCTLFALFFWFWRIAKERESFPRSRAL